MKSGIRRGRWVVTDWKGREQDFRRSLGVVLVFVLVPLVVPFVVVVEGEVDVVVPW